MGAASELVVDGETGFLRSDVAEMVECVGRLNEISPAARRVRVADNFTAETVAGYEKVFERAVGGG